MKEGGGPACDPGQSGTVLRIEGLTQGELLADDAGDIREIALALPESAQFDVAAYAQDRRMERGRFLANDLRIGGN